MIGRDRPFEPAVPVYRYLLFGGTNQLRLTGWSAVGLSVVSLVGTPVIFVASGQSVSFTAMVCLPVSAVVVSLPLAVLVAGWAGRSSGITAGLLASIGWIVAAVALSNPVVLCAMAAAITAILVYALSELPGRTTTIPPGAAAVAFYCCLTASGIPAGAAPWAAVGAVCLGTVLGNQNSRGIHFFLRPVGIVIFLGGMLIGGLVTAVADADNLRPWIVPAADGWPPWGTAVCLGLGGIMAWGCVQSGHGASPLGRLLISWLLGPPLLSLVGAIPTWWGVVISVPAWAAVTGPALVDLRRGVRVGRLPSWLRACGFRSRLVREPT
jgi:hypothetical protein